MHGIPACARIRRKGLFVSEGETGGTSDVNSVTPQEALLRYVDENKWEWRTVVKVMNRMFGADYTIDQLKDMYESEKTFPLTEADGTVFKR